jgi:biotin carboxyl carrier protein
VVSSSSSRAWRELLISFSIQFPPRTQFQLRIGDEQREIEVARQGEQLRVQIGDLAAEVRVLHRDSDQLLLEIRRPDGATRRVRLVGARRGNGRLLWVDGRNLSAERARGGAASHAADPGSLAASIPAVVSQVLVAEGDRVEPGDKLILLESMKMVIPIQAPHGGRVARILCAPGDSVPAGVPLLEIEAE